MLAVAAVASLASLPVRAETSGVKPVTPCSALSEHTVRERIALSAAGLETAGGNAVARQALAVLELLSMARRGLLARVFVRYSQLASLPRDPCQ
ncbi:MAG: hypothetical protein OXD30_11260 [Bryobacterales bacterium]|nr:hypothetical protein [Bryobacterales bacterium]